MTGYAGRLLQEGWRAKERTSKPSPQGNEHFPSEILSWARPVQADCSAESEELGLEQAPLRALRLPH